jgi:hypothetical protein
MQRIDWELIEGRNYEMMAVPIFTSKPKSNMKCVKVELKRVEGET